MGLLTRKSYKRKIITLGVTIFTAVALAATGFASWVLSSNSTADVDGGLQVGVVQDASINIEVSLSGGEGTAQNIFAFEPQRTDVSGKVKHSGNEGDFAEALTVKVTARINNAKNVGKIYVDMTVPDGVKAAAQQGYIILPTCTDNARYIVGTANAVGDATASSAATLETEGYTYTYDRDSDVATLTYLVRFGWGAKFGGDNPGIYYDKEENKDLFTHEQIIEALGTMKAVMHNTDWATYSQLTESQKQMADLSMGDDYKIGTYLFKIHAEVK